MSAASNMANTSNTANNSNNVDTPASAGGDAGDVGEVILCICPAHLQQEMTDIYRCKECKKLQHRACRARNDPAIRGYVCYECGGRLRNTNTTADPWGNLAANQGQQGTGECAAASTDTPTAPTTADAAPATPAASTQPTQQLSDQEVQAAHDKVRDLLLTKSQASQQ